MAFSMEVSGGEGLPIGSYHLAVDGFEDFNEHADKYGPAVKVRFVVTSGDHKDELTTRIASKKLSSKSTLGKLVASILGRPLEKGEAIDLDSLVGVKGFGVVEATEGGSTRLGTFIRS